MALQPTSVRIDKRDLLRRVEAVTEAARRARAEAREIVARCVEDRVARENRNARNRN
jgi:hypothetical protein